MRPNYIFSSERPKYYPHDNKPIGWSQLGTSFVVPTGILTQMWNPDPSLIQSYARYIYPKACSSDITSTVGCDARTNIIRTLPGGSVATGAVEDFSDKSDYLNLKYEVIWDESKSMFIDRPFTDIGYEQVMDVYGYIGEPYRLYKKVGSPAEMKDAIGVAVFVYSLFEEMDNSDRAYPINIGYYMHGGYNYDVPKGGGTRTLGHGEGTYIEIQNEHNYMGGSPQNIIKEMMTVESSGGKEKGLMSIAHPLNTPPTCYRAGQAPITEPMNFLAAESEPTLFDGPPPGAKMPGFVSDTDATAHKTAVPKCGSARLPLTSTRFFRFPDGPAPEAPNYLKDPLWLAAKYGGFNDKDHDGYPTVDEYDVMPAPNGDGIPDNYFYASNLSELKDKLSEAFERIMSSMNVGTATSASVNSVLGGGVTVRTFFQSLHSPESDLTVPEINWIGGTYALFVDNWGNMREDTNGNGQLDLLCDEESLTSRNNSRCDWIVQFVNCSNLNFTLSLDSSDEPRYRQACNFIRDTKDIKTVVYVFPSRNGGNAPLKNLDDPAKFISLSEIKTVWNLSSNLSKLSNTAVVTPRASYQAVNSGRLVYFHHEELTPLSSNGGLEVFKPQLSATLAKYLLQTQPNAEKLIKYILGLDQEGYRSRTTVSPWADLTGKVTCRLGDVINSQPIIVGAPFSNYDYLFKDRSYAAYKSNHSKRRNISLVGANDGMLHAINMGYQTPLSNGSTGYSNALDSTSTDQIGKEMWAFIPQSLLPHLQWLSQLDYPHSYYMDLTPTVVEIKKPNGEWMTMLLGSLRLGGRAIQVSASPPKYSYSEVFAMDVTDPESPPKLLWRFSHPQMGLVVARPTVVRNDGSGDSWYVLVASGPTYDDYDPVAKVTKPAPDKGRLAYEGHSNQSAKVFYFNALNGPGGNNANVKVLDTNLPNSFIPQFQVVNAFDSRTVDGSVVWSNSLAYFSVNQSAPDNALLCLKASNEADAYLNWSNPNDRCPTNSKFSNSGRMDKGAVYRLQMADSDGKGLNPTSWPNYFKLFFNSDRPVSAAVNTTMDAQGRLWVLFGTGRYWTNEDSRLCDGYGVSDSELKSCRLNHYQYIYGIREKYTSAGKLSFETVQDNELLDVSNVLVVNDNTIEALSATGGTETFTTSHGPMESYDALSKVIFEKYQGYKRVLRTSSLNYIGTEDFDSPDSYDSGKDDEGWWRGLSYEMVLEQIAVAPFGNLGSTMALSSFLPLSITCGSYGQSYGMLLDTFTGLPRPEFGRGKMKENNKFQDVPLPPKSNGAEYVSDHISAVGGKASAAVLVMTGVNEQKKSQFEIVNSDGTVSIFKLEQDGVKFSGGVLSWREVLDYSSMAETDPDD
jgi:Tfp pilus tip-associated adhesin PilY1